MKVCTKGYRWVHGREPRGRGAWAFRMDGADVFAPGGEQNYGTARQWAVMEAKSRKAQTVAVAP